MTDMKMRDMTPEAILDGARRYRSAQDHLGRAIELLKAAQTAFVADDMIGFVENLERTEALLNLEVEE